MQAFLMSPTVWTDTVCTLYIDFIFLVCNRTTDTKAIETVMILLIVTINMIEGTLILKPAMVKRLQFKKIFQKIKIRQKIQKNPLVRQADGELKKELLSFLKKWFLINQ